MRFEDVRAGSGRFEKIDGVIREVGVGHDLATIFAKTEHGLSIFESALEAKESELVKHELAAGYGYALRRVVSDLIGMLDEHLDLIRVRASSLIREGSSEAGEVLKLGIATDNLRDRMTNSLVEHAREQIIASIQGREYNLPLALALLEKESARINFSPDVRDPIYVESGIYKSEGKMVRELVRDCAKLFSDSFNIPMREWSAMGELLGGIFKNVSYSLTNLTAKLNAIANEARTASDPAEIKRGISAVQTLIATATPIKEFHRPRAENESEDEVAGGEAYHRNMTIRNNDLERELFVRVAGREYAFASYNPSPNFTVAASKLEGLGGANAAMVSVIGDRLECYFENLAPLSDSAVSNKSIIRSANVSLSDKQDSKNVGPSPVSHSMKFLFEPTGRAALCSDNWHNKVQLEFCNGREFKLSKPRDLDSPSGFAVSPDGTKVILRDWLRLAVMLADGPKQPMGGVYQAVNFEGLLMSAVFFGNDHVVSLVSESRANTHTDIECLSLDGRFTKQWLAKLPFDVRSNPKGFIASAEASTLAFLPKKDCSTIWMADATTQEDGLDTFNEYSIPVEGILQTTVTPDLRMAVVRTKGEIYVLDLLGIKNRDPANVVAVIKTPTENPEVCLISDDGSSLVLSQSEAGSSAPTRLFDIRALSKEYSTKKKRAGGDLLPT